MINVRVSGSKWWEDRIYYLSSGGIENVGAAPALRKLDIAFRQTLTDLFSPGGGPGVEYKHGHTGSYLSNLHSVITSDSLRIIEGSPKGGPEIRSGGKPGSYPDIVKWAREKLGKSLPVAEKMAEAIQKRGHIGGGSSPMRNEYPSGEGKFAYPEWIVEVKNKRDIDDASRTVETLIVRYLS